MSSERSAAQSGEYVVVARRYRPQSFQELVGQHQVSKALRNAIDTNRVGHAYLFTGARGVGKTSTARIFAKALNCQAPSEQGPCNECDVCLNVSEGEDVDVLEIDGASNRGIDEIRQLRSNVNIRPSRSRFKIYIIDEVHMLTTQAFNALLKTLEEPPEHVKFFFCTTDPEKIPITVLSRCQRYDFAPVQTEEIQGRLQSIAQQEQVEVEEEALALLARRAAGSMRDSQSLLEQLLSFCTGRITLDDVHAMFGTARSGRLAQMAAACLEHDPKRALAELDAALRDGVDAGQFCEQLLGYFRDLMAVTVGCEAEFLTTCSASEFEELEKAGKACGLETAMAILQVLDQTLVRMRQSTHARALFEIGLVRISRLERLDDLGQLVANLKAGALATSAPAAPSPHPEPSPARSAATPSPAEGGVSQKKNSPRPQPSPAQPQKTANLDRESAESIWKQTLSQIEDMTADYASYYQSVAISGPNLLVVTFSVGYTLQKEGCERPDRKSQIEETLSAVVGKPMRVDFVTGDAQQQTAPVKRKPSLRQRMRDAEDQPFVKEAVELFEAEIVRLDEPKPGRTSRR